MILLKRIKRKKKFLVSVFVVKKFKKDDMVISSFLIFWGIEKLFCL